MESGTRIGLAGPGGLLRQGRELLQSSPQLSGLSRLGGPLVSAG
ncbi:hypothetical protein C5N14_00820 [Micromonospora sp. MW-13]|nr:hypothetical protein C5N14_00820 [Micromonospora sp. MW-13]